MKATFSHLLVLPSMMLAASFASGCYTQLLLEETESANIARTESTPVDALPQILIIETIVPISPPSCPRPSVAVTNPIVVTRPDKESRNVGNQRSTPNRSESASSGTRTSGSTRGGR